MVCIKYNALWVIRVAVEGPRAQREEPRDRRERDRRRWRGQWLKGEHRHLRERSGG
jgi:hypothetical protein